MGIYSPNRMGGSAAALNVVANENYAPIDMGMVMYESACNDMAIFEATLKADFMEIKGLQEGTLLESELSALNEANAKALFTSLKTSLKKFWEKIKGIFQNAINKIATAVSGERALIKRYDEAKKNAPKDFKIEFKLVPAKENVFADPDVEGMVRNNINAEELKRDELIGGCLAKAVGASEKLTAKEFNAKAFEKWFDKDVTVTNVNAPEIANMIEVLAVGRSAAIKSVNAAKAIAESELRKLERELINAENAVERNKDSKEEDKKHAKVLSNIGTLVSAAQSVISISTRTSISLCKKQVAVSASGIRKVINACTGAQHEYALLVEEVEAELAMEDVPGVEADEITPEIQEVIDAAVEE